MKMAKLNGGRNCKGTERKFVTLGRIYFNAPFRLADEYDSFY